MKKIYPNCYEAIPVPNDEGYMVFKCGECKNNWLYNTNYKDEEDTVCPYCGLENTQDYFYQQAYQDAFNYAHFVSLKNLLELINIEIDVIEQNVEDIRFKYQVRFVNIEEPNEKQMSEYIKLAYEELKKRAENKTLEAIYHVPIRISDIVKEDEFVLYKTPCCELDIKVNETKPNIKHCIYCKSQFIHFSK